MFSLTEWEAVKTRGLDRAVCQKLYDTARALQDSEPQKVYVPQDDVGQTGKEESGNSYLLDGGDCAAFVENSRQIRRILDAKRDIIPRIQNIVARMQDTLELDVSVPDKADPTARIRHLERESETKTAEIEALEARITALMRENVELSTLLHRHEEQRQMERERQELLIETLRSSIQEMTQEKSV